MPNAGIRGLIEPFDDAPIRHIEYRRTDAYVITRRFPENPGRALGELSTEDATADGGRA